MRQFHHLLGSILLLAALATAADVFLRRHGFYIEVEALDGHAFIYGSTDRHEFRFAQILDWIRRHVKPLV